MKEICRNVSVHYNTPMHYSYTSSNARKWFFPLSLAILLPFSFIALQSDYAPQQARAVYSFGLGIICLVVFTVAAFQPKEQFTGRILHKERKQGRRFVSYRVHLDTGSSLPVPMTVFAMLEEHDEIRGERQALSGLLWLEAEFPNSRDESSRLQLQKRQESASLL